MNTTLPSDQTGRVSLLAGALFLFSSLLFSAIAAPSPARLGLSGPVSGEARVIAGERIRLEGIDAPERGQTCKAATGRDWSCGTAAADRLRTLIKGQAVTCEPLGVDKYERMLGHCAAGATNLNRAMVETGFAWAFVKYSSEFVDAEAQARATHAGIWQGPATAPWDYRAGNWQTAEPVAPAGCAIKGNISDRGHVYHMPWSPWYAKVKIDSSHGERWFCSEADAIAAGWRAASPN